MTEKLKAEIEVLRREIDRLHDQNKTLIKEIAKMKGLMMSIDKFRHGDRVRKKSGYAFHGVVVSVFEKLDCQTRYVVECTVPGCEGMLHIFNEDQLEHETSTDA